MLIAILVVLCAMGAGSLPGATVVAALLALLGLVHVLWGADQQRAARACVPGGWASLLLLLLALLSLLPLPIAWTGDTWSTEGVALLRELSLPAPLLLPLASNPAGATRVALLLFLVLATATLASCTSDRGQSRLRNWLLGIATIVAISGILERVYPSGAYWGIVPTHFGQALGPFLSRNHFAGFCAIGLVVALVHFGRHCEDRSRRTAIPLACALVLGLAIVWSYSRLGLILAASGALAVVIGVAVAGKRRAGVRLSVVVAGVLIAAGVLVSGHSEARLESMRRAGADNSLRFRSEVIAASFNAWKDRPLVGAGGEGFRVVFPRYTSVPNPRHVTHAENEYVQLLVDFGLLGWLLFLLAAAHTVRRVRFRTPWSVIAAGAACIVVCLQACFDFALHTPLYAVSAILLLSPVLCPVPHCSVPPGAEPTSWAALQRERAVRLQRRLLQLLVLLGSVLILTAVRPGANIYRLDHTWHLGHGDLALVSRALYRSPQDWFPWYRLAMIYHHSNEQQKANRCAEFATRLAPQSSHTWQLRAQILRARGKTLDAIRCERRAEKVRWQTPAPPH